MSWPHILLVLVILGLGTAGLILMDLGNLTDLDLCNGWFCVKAQKMFHLGEYLALAGLWGLAALLLWVWSK